MSEDRTLRVSRVPMYTDKAELSKSKLPPEPTPEQQRKALVDGILAATAKFAAQDAFIDRNAGLSDRERAVIEALAALDGTSTQAPIKKVAEALLGKKLSVPGAERVIYNMLAAFVPLDNNNGHAYALNKVSVSITRYDNGRGSLNVAAMSLQNTPPEYVAVGGVIQIRPATREEIMGLSEDALSFIEKNVALAYVYPKAD